MAKDKDPALKAAKKEKKRKDSETNEVAMEVDVEPSVEEPVKKKSKKEKKTLTEDEIVVDLDSLCPIAHPLAERKLAKRVFRTVKKAAKQRRIRRGVKEVVKSLRKGETGLVVMAADISPMDILSHIPVLSEDTKNPYIFIPSKELLGQASNTKRPTSCIMIVPQPKRGAMSKPQPALSEEKQKEFTEFTEAYGEVVKEIEGL